MSSLITVVESLADLRQELAQRSRMVGFVPTMGALHQGHGRLMERARSENETVVVSVFVNPTQFAPGEDFERYPRTRESDIDLCRAAGVDLVWFAQVEELYPVGAQTWVEVEGLGQRFEGESRPGHFRGVATVVSKLFHAVQPTRAYFGQKDLQQLFVIRQMVRDLLFHLEVVAVPTARERSGLAMSSRNTYLSPEQREKAGTIFSSLLLVREAYRQGMREPGALRELFLRATVGLQAELERFDLLDSRLERLYQDGESVDSGYCSVALRLGKVRLIDNIELCF